MFLLFIGGKTKYCYSAARRKEPNVDRPTRTHFVAIFAQCNICQQYASSKFDFSFVQCVDVIVLKALVYSAPYLLPPCWRRKNFLADIFPSPPLLSRVPLSVPFHLSPPSAWLEEKKLLIPLSPPPRPGGLSSVHSF